MLSDDFKMAKELPAVNPPISAGEPSSSTLLATKAEKAASIPRKWNTKNLGLRLGVDAISAASAAGSAAPIITIIDRAIMENASGRNTLQSSLQLSVKNFLLRPQSLLFSKPFALIFLLYGGTYLTSNTIDTASSTARNQPPTLVTSGSAKFAASSAANIGLCIYKDQAFVRMFGPAGGAPRPVPLPSYALFAIRDCLTIFASFNVPPLLGPVLARQMGDAWSQTISGATAAQFLAPAAIQLLSTPLHLLGLDLYNRNARDVTWSDRLRIVKKNWPVTSLARMGRIVPAFGVGGVVNGKVRRRLMERMD